MLCRPPVGGAARVTDRPSLLPDGGVLVRHVLTSGKPTRGSNNTTGFTQGSGRNRLRVVVDLKSGTVITVTQG